MPVWYIFGLAAELYSFLTMFVTGLPLCSHLEIKSLPDTKLLHQRDGCGLQQVNLQNMTNNLYTTPTNSSQPNTDICVVHTYYQVKSLDRKSVWLRENFTKTHWLQNLIVFFIYIYIYITYMLTVGSLGLLVTPLSVAFRAIFMKGANMSKASR